MFEIIALVLIVAAICVNLFEVFKLREDKIDVRIKWCSGRLSIIALSTILQLIGIIQQLGSLTTLSLGVFAATFVYMVITIATIDTLVAIKILKNERVG